GVCAINSVATGDRAISRPSREVLDIASPPRAVGGRSTREADERLRSPPVHTSPTAFGHRVDANSLVHPGSAPKLYPRPSSASNWCRSEEEIDPVFDPHQVGGSNAVAGSCRAE